MEHVAAASLDTVSLLKSDFNQGKAVSGRVVRPIHVTKYFLISQTENNPIRVRNPLSGVIQSIKNRKFLPFDDV
jgi:hypothetical protein